MIVADTSALIALLAGETGSARIEDALSRSQRTVCSTVTLVEATLVAARAGDAAATAGIDHLLAAFEIEALPVDVAQAQIARRAFLRYGKGRHPAGLNICDCFSYALAVAQDAPLLCKGEDFPQTDVKLVLPGNWAAA